MAASNSGPLAEAGCVWGLVSRNDAGKQTQRSWRATGASRDMYTRILKKTLVLAAIAICILLPLAPDIVNWFFVTMENRGSREFWSEALSRSVVDCLTRDEYSQASYMLRQLKATCEKLGGRKGEYLSVLEKMNSGIPCGVSREKLPHDLRVSDPDEVRFGLFSRGSRRLQGTDRRAELLLLADEVWSASEEGNDWAVESYADFLDRMNRAQLLSGEELILIKDCLQDRVKRATM